MADCLFCRIIEKKIPSRIEFEDDQILAIQDVNPQAPIHILLVSKKHIGRIADLTEEDIPVVGGLVYRARKIAEAKKASDKGFRLVFNSGPEGGQTVFHIHLHLLAGRSMHWPPG